MVGDLLKTGCFQFYGRDWLDDDPFRMAVNLWLDPTDLLESSEKTCHFEASRITKG